MSQDNLQHSGAARIHHCLLRVCGNSDMKALTKGLTTIGNTFAHFAHLETIVLEIGYRLWTYNVQSLIEALRKVSRVEVQHRTSDEGHKLALQAKKTRSHSKSTGLLSPFWCWEQDSYVRYGR